MQDEKILIELARLILPSGFVENFKITSIVSNESDVEISLMSLTTFHKNVMGTR